MTFDPKTGVKNAALVGDMKPERHHCAASRSPSKPTASRNEAILMTAFSFVSPDMPVYPPAPIEGRLLTVDFKSHFVTPLLLSRMRTKQKDVLCRGDRPTSPPQKA